MYNLVMPSTSLAPNPQLQTLIGDLIVVTNRLTRLAARATGNATSPAIWRTLSVLSAQGPMRVGELATETRVAQPTATKIVKSLAESEWIKRVADVDDARAWQIAIAPEGEKALAEWREKLSTSLAPLFDDLTVDEIRTLDHAVAIITGKVGQGDRVAFETSEMRVTQR